MSLYNKMVKEVIKETNGPQCQYFVVRKKRLCRMTVRPGNQYCGEHQPQPENCLSDQRVPCPNDPKHTCFISKLEKHLAICNARQVEQPSYINHNINTPNVNDAVLRTPLSEIPSDVITQVIYKVNQLYDKHIASNIAELSDTTIHDTVLPEFSEPDRQESSLRHLRQTSRLLHLVEEEGLVDDGTCYVELGAGKGQLSYYAYKAWCVDTASTVLLIDRASLRHKRDNKLHACDVTRLRADLAHLALHRVAVVDTSTAVVGLAKHLCGVATDYALRCIVSEGVLPKTKGVVIATCCHHRCEYSAYVANTHLKAFGITAEDLNAMLGIVSWATCGDGRNRQSRINKPTSNQTDIDETTDTNRMKGTNDSDQVNEITEDLKYELRRKDREKVGRKAKAILDWGRILYLREKGFEAKLCYYVPTKVSLENVCIVAKKM